MILFKQSNHMFFYQHRAPVIQDGTDHPAERFALVDQRTHAAESVDVLSQAGASVRLTTTQEAIVPVVP